MGGSFLDSEIAVEADISSLLVSRLVDLRAKLSIR